MSRSVDPQSAQIVRTIVEFERSVEDAESALVVRDWARIDALLLDQRRLTHALANALDASHDRRPQAFTDEVNRRLELITARRADQMQRLIAFNHSVNARLKMIAQAKQMRHPSGDAPLPRLLDLLQ